MSRKETDGCIHLYCGDGKGKTSAAIGLAVRAAGRGKRVLIARFLKQEDSGEVGILRSLDGIEILPCDKEFGFYFRMTAEQKEEAAACYRQMFETACQIAGEKHYDVLILDEIVAACNYELVSQQAVLAFLGHRPAGLEVVMTGRNPSEQLKGMADYISVIQMEKHPYQQGLPARSGIEY